MWEGGLAEGAAFAEAQDRVEEGGAGEDEAAERGVAARKVEEAFAFPERLDAVHAQVLW